MTRAAARRQALSEGAVVTKAVLRAAGRLGASNRLLSRAIGLSEASVSRMGTGTYVLNPGDKPFELALLLVRVSRALDAIVGGDDEVARAWMQQDNTALGGRPVDLIQTVPGLLHVVGYLDARRALV